MGGKQALTQQSTGPHVLYKPVSQNGDIESDQARMQSSRSKKTDLDSACGVWTIRPPFLQPCANIRCFTAFYSLAALMTSTLSVYVNSQVTTLERQFGFTSQQTGMIMAANDIGYLICVLFVSYSASRMHIPRSLGAATMMFGLSGIACSLPHFIYGASVTPEPEANGYNRSSTMTTYSRKASMYGDLCDTLNNTHDMCKSGTGQASGNSAMTPEYVATSSLVIIMLGMILQGFGKAPRGSFTITYIDDNTSNTSTGFFMGIIITVGMLGPAVAFLMGGIFSRIYVTLQSTKLHPHHPKWIGAWWLGYIVFGCMALVISVPLFWFPRRLPKAKTKERQQQNDNECGEKSKAPAQRNGSTNPAHPLSESNKKIHGSVLPTNSQPKPSSHQQYRQSLKAKLSVTSMIRVAKEFLTSLLRLWTNLVYMMCVASTCFILFAVGGSSAYSPKYLEQVFDLPAFKANYIMAAKTLFAACVGTFVGGYLSKRFKMTAMKALKFVILIQIIAFCCTAMGFVFRCDQPTVLNSPSAEKNCSSKCHCEDNTYFPICGGDGNTYYSPCHAGCVGVEQGVYHNCTCIPGGTATSGMCDYSCNHLYPFAIFNALRSLFGTLTIIPKMIVLIRCVSNKDKSFAVGFSSFMASLLGWLLGPVIFGHFIDGVCTIWDIKCGVTGRCLLYDNDLFRLKLHSYSIIAAGCAFTCTLIAYIWARRTKCLDDDAEERVKNMEMSVSAKNDDVKNENSQDDKDGQRESNLDTTINVRSDDDNDRIYPDSNEI